MGTKLIFAVLSIFLSLSLFAYDDWTGGYTTTNRTIKKLVETESDIAFTYGLLRRAKESDSRDFERAANEIWIETRKNHEVDLDALEDLVNDYWSYLNSDQQAIARGLKLAREPHFWGRCEAQLGPTATSAIKCVAAFVIISSMVVMPVAAAVMPALQGSFQSSCRDVSVDSYRSIDRKIGDVYVVRAQCEGDRACHGLTTNEIAFPAEASGCNFLHNNNGTLVVTDSPYFSGDAVSQSTSGCPPLAGSFTKTCGTVSSSEYKSSDPRIPTGAYCKYKVKGCATTTSGTENSELVLSKPAVKCQGKLIENCDGKLELREPGKDHQCNKNWKSEL